MSSKKPEEKNTPRIGFMDIPEMRYQNGYALFAFVSCLDIILTWVILYRGGLEVNPVARVVIEAWGLPGAIIFKISLMLFVIVACEIVGRKSDLKGRGLILVAILISSFPVVWSLTLLTLSWLNPVSA
ncbi:MAG: hypothetical protein CMJ57_06455 [Planctomycetaceae bacterium]|nr:hypothetical protein [Planctomycetaceae bacterium]